MNSFVSPAQRQAYEDQGYAYLERLFPPLVLQLFHARMQTVLNLKDNPQFQSQTWLVTKPTIEVYSMHYPPMSAFHWGMTPVATQLAGRELMPTYAYFRMYQQGDICVVHSDRPACEHSLSLMVELADEAPWPLCIGHNRARPGSQEPQRDFGEEGYSSIAMKAGDAVMYRGVDRRHGRVQPNPNRWSAHLFLHWLAADGPHADHAFDRVALEKARRRGT